MEFWCKSFGNRSILANPCNPDIKNIINIKLKEEKARPFAPAIIEEKKKNGSITLGKICICLCRKINTIK